MREESVVTWFADVVRVNICSTRFADFVEVCFNFNLLRGRGAKLGLFYRIIERHFCVKGKLKFQSKRIYTWSRFASSY